MESDNMVKNDIRDLKKDSFSYGDADYLEVKTDYRWIVQILEHRRETLQRRGRTQ